MGICESMHHGKNLENVVYKIKQDEIDPNDQTLDYQKAYQNETDLGQNIFNYSQTKNSFVQKNIDKPKPKLEEYDRSINKSGEEKTFYNNHTSIYSSRKSEAEVIINGEINKEAKNKEEDFVNKSFKNLVKKSGGIIIKADDLSSNLSGSKTEKSLLNLGIENISEIGSNKATSIQNNDIKLGNSIKSSISTINLSIIKGINDNELMYNNDDINKKQFHKNSIINNSDIISNKLINNKLRESNKINISLHESYPRIESFVNLPKTDIPLPDLSELSESRLSNSISSRKKYIIS